MIELEGQKPWLDVLLEFAKNIRIASKEETSSDDRGVPLKMWGSQKYALQQVCNGMDEGVRNFMVLKSRQLGISTIFLVLDLLWLALHPNLIGALVTDTDTNRAVFRQTLERYVASFPKGFLGKNFTIVKKNKDFLLFSNGSRLDLIVAGKSKANWGEGRGYALCHLTEVASYGNVSGLNSFKETLAEKNPNRLFLYESTAKGFNHWYDMWIEYGRDKFTKKGIFIGWWAKDINIIKEDDRMFELYGAEPPTEEEQELINEVKEKYGFDVSMEQLAWYRWKASDQSTNEMDLLQNVPWTESQAFVMSGYSFFQNRLLTQNMEIAQTSPFWAYGYKFTNQFKDTRMYEITSQAELEEATLRVWEQPSEDEDAVYAIGCDPAYGRNDWKDRHCSGSDTEILTKAGWKTYDQIKIGEDVVCFDPETSEYKYGPIQDLIIKQYEGPMYNFTSDGLDCHVTPEHRIYSTYWDNRKKCWHDWQVKTAEVTAESSSRIQRVIPTGGGVFGPGIPELSLDMCRALGWIITDGYCSSSSENKNGTLKKNLKGRGTCIVLSQAKLTNKGGLCVYEEIDKILPTLTTFFRNVRPANDKSSEAVTWRIRSEESEKFLQWLDRSNIHKIPHQLIEDCSKEQCEALFQGLMEGDGSWDDRWGWIKFSPGQATELADGLQELALKLGYSATRTIQHGEKVKDQWLIRLSKRQFHSIKKQVHTPVPYKGVVWCVTVPTGAFVARRNGKAFVTGNCVSVWRCYADCIVQVAEYADNQVETRQAAWALAHLAGTYRNCYVNVELTGGPGRAVLTEFEHLRELAQADPKLTEGTSGQPNFEDFLANAKWYLFKRADSFSAGNMKGWEMTGRSKFELMNQVRDQHSTGALRIRSIHLLNEMKVVTQDGSEIAAPGRAKDDRVFAMALAVRVWIDSIRSGLIARQETYEAVSARESGTSTQLETFTHKLVQNFFLRQAELADAVPDQPQWKIDRGLV